MARKTSRGRQRIAMEKIQNESSLQVTFSKRRSGIMKKCNELSTLTGAEMAVVIFSPRNKAYSFFNPSLEIILNRFQDLQIPSTLTERMYQHHQKDKLKTLNEEIDLLKEEHEAERKLKKLMDQISEIEEKNNYLYLEDSVENLNEGLLEKLKDAFQEVNKMAEKKVKTQKINLEIQRKPLFHFQNVYSTGSPTFGGGGFNFISGGGGASNSINTGVPMAEAPVVASHAGTSTFGDGCFHIIPGGGDANSNINNGVQMNVPSLAATAPAVVSFVVPQYGPIQGYLPLF